MIDLLYLSNYLQQTLNENSLGKEFKIFASEGDLVSNSKKGSKIEKYTQGLVKITSSTVTPIKNLSFSVLNLELMVLPDNTDLGIIEVNGNNQSKEFIEAKQCVNEMIDKLNGATIQMEQYNVTIATSRAIEGDKMSLGHIIETIPLYINFTLNVFENGVNSNECRIVVNGEDLYFTRAVISKIRTAEQQNFARCKGGRTSITIGGKSIDMSLICVNSEVGNSIMRDILQDNLDNYALAVSIITPLHIENFIGIFGNGSLNLDVGANAGFNVSIVQGYEPLLIYDKNWEVFKTSEPSYTRLFQNKGIVFWGDGTSEQVEINQTITHNYEVAEPHTVRVFKYGV